jgi:ankyrin repeat protein
MNESGQCALTESIIYDNYLLTE